MSVMISVSGDAAEKAVDDLFSGDVRFSFSDDDDSDDEGGEELTCRSHGKGKGKSNGTRNKRAASRQSHQAVRTQLRKRRRRAKASKEYRAPISGLERMRGRGGTDMTTGIKGSGLGGGLKDVCTALS
jgi:hypothetical protein